MKISDDIKYKIHFIIDKQNNGEELTREEENYLRKYQEFMQQIESFQIKKELEQFELPTNRILEFLNKKEKEIRAIIPKTRSRHKLLEFQKMLLRIKKLKTTDLSLFKYYIEETYPYNRNDINRYIAYLISSDDYIKSGRMGDNNSSFASQNYYTGQITINRANILLAKEILGGNFQYYEALNQAREYEKTQEERKKLIESVPQELRNVNPIDLSRIHYYAKGRIGTEKEKIFYQTGDVLDYLLMLDDLQSQPVSKEHQSEIEEYALNQIAKYVDGEIPEQKISRYNICRFIPDNFYSEKMRNMLIACNYDLNALLASIKNDDLIRLTILNSSEESGLVDSEGNINLPNVTLACEIIDGNYRNYNLLEEYYSNGFPDSLLEQIPQNLRNANPIHMSRIIHYGVGRIGNPNNHDYDKEYYDLKVLKILAEYQHALGCSQEKKEEQSKKCS